MKRIGLTGGIASGKSLIVDMLRRQGIPVIDADELSRDVAVSGSKGLSAILARFGKEYALPDGTLDRKKLGALIFQDEVARKDLEAITHPLIGQAMADRFGALENEGHAACVYCAPLMFEKKLEVLFDAVILVFCDEATQIARLQQRDGLTKAEAAARIASQMPLADKIAKTPYRINNSQTPSESARQLSNVWHQLTSETRQFS